MYSVDIRAWLCLSPEVTKCICEHLRLSAHGMLHISESGSVWMGVDTGG